MTNLVLQDLCTAIVDCAHKTAPIDDAGDYFAVGTPAMKGNIINYSEARRISRSTFEAWTTRLRPRVGDLLLAREAPVGPVVSIPSDENVAPGQRTVLLRPDPSIVGSRFLYYYLTSPARQNDLLVKASGSTVPHLNVADVRTLPTPGIPPLSEQRAISEMLGALDDKAAANNRITATSAALASAEFARATVGGLRVSVGNVAELMTRGVTPSYTDAGGILVLNQKCVRNQKVDLEPARLTKPFTKRLDKMLRRHDVLVNSTGYGTLGRVARWTDSIQATADSHITIVRFDSSAVDPVCAGFGLTLLEDQIEALAEGSTGQTELRRDLLAKLIIVLPGRSQQEGLGRRLDNYDFMIKQLNDESHMLATAKRDLLPSLMSGRIRVRDAEKVVEEVV